MPHAMRWRFTDTQPSNTPASRTLSSAAGNGYLEGHHRVARVGGDDALQQRHGALNLLLRQEAEDAEHGEAAVVDLGDEQRLLLLGRQANVPLERVVQVEADPVGKLLRGRVEGRKVAGLASLHVVRGAVEPDLRPPLKEANAKDNLPLGNVGKR